MTETLTAIVARNVRALRDTQGVSAQALSDRCAAIGFPVPRNTIANLENGRREGITLEEADVLARGLGVTLGDLTEQVSEGRAPAPLAGELNACRRVQELREVRRWSQSDLARKLSEYGFDMHQTTVAKLEKGKRPLRFAEALALEAIFEEPLLAARLLPGAAIEQARAKLAEALALLGKESA